MGGYSLVLSRSCGSGLKGYSFHPPVQEADGYALLHAPFRVNIIAAATPMFGAYRPLVAPFIRGSLVSWPRPLGLARVPSPRA